MCECVQSGGSLQAMKAMKAMKAARLQREMLLHRIMMNYLNTFAAAGRILCYALVNLAFF